jgi:hypothetical protein
MDTWRVSSKGRTWFVGGLGWKRCTLNFKRKSFESSWRKAQAYMHHSANCRIFSALLGRTDLHIRMRLGNPPSCLPQMLGHVDIRLHKSAWADTSSPHQVAWADTSRHAQVLCNQSSCTPKELSHRPTSGISVGPSPTVRLKPSMLFPHGYNLLMASLYIGAKHAS